ncbi:peptidoglycan D,D-transpeptidase FtsI family protein [Bacillus alkalicellulosilyticus]|uniref:peptidoglycan D,D-transpeptidase FtsI family protein n=1 Tax=Alkalihalobacterium alkalicellulosilyticum TaxID=1912214 RepID=UPI0009976C0D|nr:penicillin-binding protein 2 [Bacillus alkalicellulosilyticus]
MGNNKKKKNHVPTRLNLLFFVVFILFSALILRLGFVQIVQGEEYVKVLERTSNVTARIDAPRGLMYDRFGNIVVDNELELSITYTPGRSTGHDEKLTVARKLERLIEVDEDALSKITFRDKQDYWILLHQEEARALVTPEERRELDGDPKKEYELTLKRITEDMLETFTDEELRVLAIKREMDRGYALAPQRIKQGINEEEAHIVGEHLFELPGVDILRDSSRKYVYGDTFRSLLGRTGSIPREKIDYFLSRGYERSDIVGTSFLELQYEEALRGQKALVESVTSRGTVIGEREQLGQRGNDLVLTIDMELQQSVQEIVDTEVEAGAASFLDKKEAYIVMMNPKTGEILAITGYDGDETGALNKSFAMGSAVKGATMLAGFHEGVVSPGEVIYDRPIQLPASPPKKSHENMGNINDLVALERSSNIYMFYIAMRTAGYNYGSNCCWRDIPGTYMTLRNYYGQFGLGTETGIDLPSVSSGLSGGVGLPGNLLDLSIGQFDTYTTLQLAQYVSTIANDGYRMQPHLVKEIREPSRTKEDLGPVVYQHQPRIMNRIEMADSHIKRVQEGFRRVVTPGYRGTWGSAGFSYEAAAKTGTAQVRVPVERNGNRVLLDGNNQTLVAWAPYDDPEIAVAVVVPHVRTKDAYPISRRIMKESMDTYFQLKNVRNGPLRDGEERVSPTNEDVEE